MRWRDGRCGFRHHLTPGASWPRNHGEVEGPGVDKLTPADAPASHPVPKESGWGAVAAPQKADRN